MSLRATKHLGRRLWKRRDGYHRRSLAEIAMSRPKRLGERLSARDPAPQVAEVQIRCAILNAFYALGMPDTCQARYKAGVAALKGVRRIRSDFPEPFCPC